MVFPSVDIALAAFIFRSNKLSRTASLCFSLRSRGYPIEIFDDLIGMAILILIDIRVISRQLARSVP